MEAVIDDFCPPPGQPTTMFGGGLFTRLVDLVRRSLGAQQDKTELALALGARNYGQMILAAETSEELDEVLEELAWRRDFHAYYTVLTSNLPPGNPTAEKIQESVHAAELRIPYDIRPLFRDKLVRLERAFLTQLAVVERAEEERPPGEPPLARDVDLGSFLFDITVPPPLLDCLLGGVKCLLAQLALTEALMTERKPQPAQIDWLLESAIEGVIASLRLAPPETPNIHEFVAAEQFIDVDQLMTSWSAARLGLEAAAKRATQSGRKIFPLVDAARESGEGDRS